MEPDDVYCGVCGQKYAKADIKSEPIIDGGQQMESEEFKALEAKLNAEARVRPSDVEAPAQEMQ